MGSKMPSAHVAVMRNEPARRDEIKRLKRELKKLLKRGECVYLENASGRCPELIRV